MWREAARAVSGFRLNGDSLAYRTVGARRERVLPLASVRAVVLYYDAGRHRSACGFTLHTAGRPGQLRFDFYWLSGVPELRRALEQLLGLTNGAV